MGSYPDTVEPVHSSYDSVPDWRGSVGSYLDTVEQVHSSYDSVGFQLMGKRARERDLRIVLVQGVTKAGNKPWLVNPNAASRWMLDGSLTHLTL